MAIPISNFQSSLAVTQFVPLQGVFPPRDVDETNDSPAPYYLGMIRGFAGHFGPEGAPLAAGQLLPISQHTALFSLLGNTYGGDGRVTFGLPDLRGHTPIGAGQGGGLTIDHQLGDAAGAAGIQLTTDQLPSALGGVSEPIDNYQPSLPITYLIRTTGTLANMSGIDLLGGVAQFAGNFVPTGYMLAAGQMLSIADHTDLFAMLGTTFGGNGVTTFALPDLSGSTVVGAGGGIAFGTVSGAETVSLTNDGLAGEIGGMGAPIDNRQPTVTLNYLIATQGIFPSQNGSGGSSESEPFLGEIMIFAGNFVPAGWALCAGQLLPINQNQALFALLGTTYGGNGLTHFALPNLVGSTAIGSSDAISVGTHLGADEQVVGAAHLPDIDLAGGPGADALFGGDGDDQLDGAGGNDQLRSNGGSDELSGAGGDDLLVGGAGGDKLDGGAGLDTASFFGGNGVTVSLAAGTAQFGHAQGDTLISIENLSGSAFFDELTGNGLANVLSGRGGNDVLNGSNGDDDLFGGDGNDLLFGGAGADGLDGGDGTDTANYSNSDAAVRIDLASGVNTGGHAAGDTLVSIEIVTGSSFADTLTGGTGAETFNGGNGGDILIGSLGADRLNGNQGLDTADYSGSGAAVNVNLSSGVGSGAGGFAEGDLLSSVENIVGSKFADNLIGTTGVNILSGGDGTDEFNASLGNDGLFGGGGDDVMVGGSGADAFDGGDGADWVFYSNAGGVTVNLFANTGAGNHATGDSFVSIENLFGSVAADTLVGNADANTLNGFQGADYLNGVGGDDVLLGGQGDDFLNGGPGDDVLSGSSGFDTFIYNLAGFGKDTIIGFEDGTDLIDLNAGLSFASFTETAAGSGTLLTLTADPANTILILGVAPGLIDAADFI